MLLNKLLKDMVKRQASDLHLRVGSTPIYRIDGALFRLQTENITPMVMEELVVEVLGAEKNIELDGKKDCHFAFGIKGLGRFRVSLFHQRGTPAMAIRSLALDVPDFDTLGLPDVIKDLSLKKRGLLLITGGSGSGKSTLSAAILNHINETLTCNLITIEDPIEFLHRDKKSMVAQREVGSDTFSFYDGISGAMKQDHDILFVGEIKDAKTLSAALSAAETGHMVISVMHTLNVGETLTQCTSFYPVEQLAQTRVQLSNALVGIVSLQLLPSKGDSKRVAASEVLINQGNVKDALMKGELSGANLTKLLEEGYKKYGTQSFDQSLLKLYQDEKISFETACRSAARPDDFKLRAEGIQGSDRSWSGA